MRASRPPHKITDLAITAGGKALQLQQQCGAVRQQLVVLRPHQRQRAKASGALGGLRHAVAETIEGRADQLQEQRLLGPEHPKHVGLRDARLARDRLDRRTVEPMVRELTSGDTQHLRSPFTSAHTRSHDDQITSY
jgi:hypothetical protein